MFSIGIRFPHKAPEIINQPFKTVYLSSYPVKKFFYFIFCQHRSVFSFPCTLSRVSCIRVSGFLISCAITLAISRQAVSSPLARFLDVFEFLLHRLHRLSSLPSAPLNRSRSYHKSLSIASAFFARSPQPVLSTASMTRNRS